MFRFFRQPESVILQSERHQAEIFSFGAILNQFSVRQNGRWRNIMMGFHDVAKARASLTDDFRSAKLSPFACRLNHGKFHFENKEYRCQKHVLDGHAIHGLMYNADFQIQNHGVDQTRAWLLLSAHYANDEAGFPFPYQLDVKYILDGNGLQIETTVTNQGRTNMPVADGWHPYFTLGGRADDWALQINAKQRLEFDENLLPTGQIQPESRFQAAESLRAVSLDNSFVLNNQTEVSCVLQSSELILKIYAQQNYPYLQIYVPPKRDCIAIENLSGAPDCFNNGLGRTVLQVGEQKMFVTRYELGLK